jgi:tRNA (mo5U34)-methyltransferase
VGPPDEPSPDELSPDELQRGADALAWFHSIDLGRGVSTKGLSLLAFSPDQLPDFTGRTVLDIGAWDGYYSFLAERHGAARVVALDHYAWGVDLVARGEYWAQCAAQGILPDHDRDATEFWRPDLPGKRAFDFAREALGSKVESVVGDFATMDHRTLGTFDVVLYLGVLYHMKEPLTCLERLRSVTRGVAVVETEAVHLHRMDDASVLRFHAGGDLQADFGNWFVPSIEGLRSLCAAAGFRRVERIVGPPTPVAVHEPALVKLGRRFGMGPPALPPSAPTTPYRAMVHAFG